MKIRQDSVGMFWSELPKLPPKREEGIARSQVRVIRQGPEPESTWTMPAEFPRIGAGEVIAVDLETRDPHIDTHGAGWAFSDREKFGEVSGVAVSWDNGKQAGYWPVAHARGLTYEGGNMEAPDTLWKWLQATLKQPSVTMVCHNALYDWGWLERSGVTVLARVEDTATYAALLNEHRRAYSLDALLKVYFGPNEGKDETLLREAAEHFGVDPKYGMWRLPAKYVGAYAEQDARGTLKLRHVLQQHIEKQELGKIFELETELIPVVIAMRQRGVRIDVEHVMRLDELWKGKDAEAKQKLYDMVGHEVKIGSNEDLAKAFDACNVEYPRTELGSPSFTKDWLKMNGHPLCQALLDARKFDKANSTFIQGALLDHIVDGRIHAQFNPLRSDKFGTISGRFSSSNPNLQQVPVRDKDIGPALRACFLPDEGYKWASCDFSQQEYRLLVHFAVKVNAPGSNKAADAYRNNPDTDFHQLVSELTGVPRSQAKNINFGLVYGMGEPKLCRQLGLPLEVINGREVPGEDGRRLFQSYHSNMPYTKFIAEECQRRARKYNAIRTIGGRRCRFPNGDKAHAALNRLIQSSAADWTKTAMIALWREGVVPHVTVHDELGFSVDSEAEATRYAEIMNNCMTCLVPMRTDVGVGANWGDAKAA